MAIQLISLWQRRRARKRAREVSKHVRRLLASHRDLMSEERIAAAEKAIAEFESKARGSVDEIAEAMEKLDRDCAKIFPAPKHPQWREVIEIGLVAAVVAWGGIRTFFLQPFKIPTGSMQPTLYGVHLDPLAKDQKVPMLPIRALEWAFCGRTYIDVTCEEDGKLQGVREGRGWSVGPFTFPQSALVLEAQNGDEREYPVSVDSRTLENQLETRLGIKPKTMFRAGEAILRCTVSSGDHIFVDKVSYNFRRPRRGEVFVFETKGIVGTQGEFYIKRLAGMPSDELQIREPELLVNGALAKEPGFVRVMSLKDGYHGYSNMAGYRYLSMADQKFALDKDEYFALGDNSYHSSDSRYWGTVPHRNLVGRALWVYWPFTKRFGLTN